MPAAPETETVSESVPMVQRACAGCEAEEEEKIDRKADGDAGISGESAVQAVNGGGEPLSPSNLSFFESRFGRDFGEVRVHADSASGLAARDLNAHAFTVGNHIAFAPGRYAPESESGKKLLAHELTHVVQQGNGNAATVRRQPAAAEPAPVAEERSLELLMSDFIDARRQSEAEGIKAAKAMIPRLKREPDKIYAYAPDLIAWLSSRNEFMLANEILDALDAGTRTKAFQDKELPPDASGSVDVLMGVAENEALSGKHISARRHFGSAFLMLQMHLYALSRRHMESATELDSKSKSLDGFDSMIRMVTYGSEAVLLGKMRRILAFYPKLEREAVRKKDEDEAFRLHVLGGSLQMDLLDHYTFDWDENPSEFLVLEATKTETKLGTPALVAHGADNNEESLTPLPGAPHPDEFDKHAYYSETMKDMVLTLGGQENLVSALLDHEGVRKEFPDGIVDLGDSGIRDRVWVALFKEFRQTPESGCDDALCSLMAYIRRYLRFFTAHTSWNIRDSGVSYLDSEFPTDLEGRVMKDCGVYAVTTAYEIFRTVQKSGAKDKVGFQLYHTLEHAMLVINDYENKRYYALSNDEIQGPKTGDPLEAIAGAYSGTLQRENFVAPAARTEELTTDLSDAQFRKRIWENYTTGADLQLVPDEPAGPDDKRDLVERREAAYDRYHRGAEGFERDSQALDGRMGKLAAQVKEIKAEDRAGFLEKEIPNSIALATRLVAYAMAFAFDTQKWGIPGTPKVATEALVLFGGKKSGEPHALGRLGRALVFHQSILKAGAVLPPDEATALSSLKKAPIKSIPSVISEYEKGPKPPEF
jgi:hypothetical protein